MWNASMLREIDIDIMFDISTVSDFYEKNSETIKQKKKPDRMKLKQLRTQMANTQINPPIVPPQFLNSLNEQPSMI